MDLCICLSLCIYLSVSLCVYLDGGFESEHDMGCDLQSPYTRGSLGNLKFNLQAFSQKVEGHTIGLTSFV